MKCFCLAAFALLACTPSAPAAPVPIDAGPSEVGSLLRYRLGQVRPLAPSAPRMLAATGPSRPSPVCANLSSAAWHVNPSTGNDQNTCTDSSHPCATPQGVFAYWGCGAGQNLSPVFNRPVTMFLHGDLAASTLFSLNVTVTSAANEFAIQCDLTSVASGTLATVTPKNRTAGQPLTADLGASYTDFLLNNTTRNASGYVKKAVTGTVQLLTQPGVANIDGFVPVDTYANGDSFTIQRPSQVYMGSVTAAGANGLAVIRNCWFQGPQSPFITGFALENDRFDSPVAISGGTLQSSDVTFQANGYSLWVLGGAISGVVFDQGSSQIQPSQITQGTGNALHNDVIVSGISGSNWGAYLFYDYVYCDPSLEVGYFWQLGGGPTPQIYGPCHLIVDPGSIVLYPKGFATTTFTGGVTLGGGLGIAIDPTTGQVHTGIPITPANLDLAVDAGGFGGSALFPWLQGGYVGE